MVGAVATVSEPASSVGGRDGGEGGPSGDAQGLVGARLGTAERLLDLQESVLDRVEVRRVGRQVAEPGAARLDGSSRPPAVVGAEVVGDDDLTRPERGHENVADVALEAGTRHAAVEAH